MPTLKTFTLAVFTVNLSLIAYSLYSFPDLFTNNRTKDLSRFDNQSDVDRVELVDHTKTASSPTISESISSEKKIQVEIWSKAAIGYYLWEHILEGKVIGDHQHDPYVYGFRKLGKYLFKFRSGPFLSLASLDQFFKSQSGNEVKSVKQNLIFVLNGRDLNNVAIAKRWLNVLRNLLKSNQYDVNIGLFMLGNENCFNNWIKPYLAVNGGFIKFLFIIYDWEAVDNITIFQWPLGVATYRNFPRPSESTYPIEKRPFVCNYIGTVYKNSSRETLLNWLQTNNNSNCILHPRWTWSPSETVDSLLFYLNSLKLSDLTLNPIGMNHECYRVYEAMAFGSVPVVEENLNHVMGQKSNCDKKQSFRLMRQYAAPILFVSNWTIDLPKIFNAENRLSIKEKIDRRANVTRWYKGFKQRLKALFFSVLNKHFSKQ